jgi:hypothetical protein
MLSVPHKSSTPGGSGSSPACITTRLVENGGGSNLQVNNARASSKSLRQMQSFD